MKIVITPEPVMLLTQPGPVTKIDKRNMAMSKKFDDDVMSANCEVILIFPIYGKFGAIHPVDNGTSNGRPYEVHFKSSFVTNGRPADVRKTY